VTSAYYFAVLFFWLIVAHAVCDYPLQGDFLAKGKNHRFPLPGVSPWICLFAHAAIHAGGVALVTGHVTLGVIELILHIAIDRMKVNGWFGFESDQLLHVLCKCVYVAVLAGGILK
jgi:hypothetical protein